MIEAGSNVTLQQVGSLGYLLAADSEGHREIRNIGSGDFKE